MDTPEADADNTALSEVWTIYITPFANALGIEVPEATEKLRPLVGEPGEQAIALLKDRAMSPDSDIRAAIGDVPSAVANHAVSLLREDLHADTATATALGNIAVLPEVPSDESWLSSLRAGGQLKVDQPTVISAVRAALAHRAGLYDIPDLLVRRMEQFADETQEPVGEAFFALRDQVTQRRYAEIFTAIPGLTGNFVTDARRNQLLGRIDDHLWPAIVSFHSQLKGWTDAWQQGAANPAVLIMMIAGRGGDAMMPPGVMAPPDTGSLRDSGEMVNDEINRVFAGTGVPIARALAYDANRIKETLEDPELPQMVGAPNREQMLRMLGVDVPATYPRLETNMTKYVLSIMQISQVAAGNEELQFFTALYMLGSQIPWDQLGAKRPSR